MKEGRAFRRGPFQGNKSNFITLTLLCWYMTSACKYIPYILSNGCSGLHQNQIEILRSAYIIRIPYKKLFPPQK